MVFVPPNIFTGKHEIPCIDLKRKFSHFYDVGNIGSLDSETFDDSVDIVHATLFLHFVFLELFGN